MALIPLQLRAPKLRGSASGCEQRLDQKAYHQLQSYNGATVNYVAMTRGCPMKNTAADITCE